MSLRILVLGANGFIGSNLIERLLATRDWRIFGVDLATHRLGPLVRDRRLTFLEADVLACPDEIDRLIDDVDVVLPLVAIATPMSYIREPLRTFEVTFESNLRVIKRCAQAGRRIVFPSTSEVYGLSDDLPFDESTSRLVLGPIHKHRWIYSASKQLLDRVIHAHGLQRGLRYTIFRPFNWIGPRLDDFMDQREGSSRVVTQFIGQILRGESLRLVDGGKQRRCFLDIDDALDALVKIIENVGGCADQRIFNLGNAANDVSIRGLAELLLELARELGEFDAMTRRVRCVDVTAAEYYGEGFQDAIVRSPSIAAARQHLGWNPQIDLETTLRKTLAHCVETLRTRQPLPEAPHRPPSTVEGRAGGRSPRVPPAPRP